MNIPYFDKDIIPLVFNISKEFVIGDVDLNTNDTPFEKKDRATLERADIFFNPSGISLKTNYNDFLGAVS
jgi:hypothetical protein